MPLFFRINVVNAPIFPVQRCEGRHFSGSAPFIPLFFLFNKLLPLFLQFNAANVAFLRFNAVDAAIFPVKRNFFPVQRR